MERRGRAAAVAAVAALLTGMTVGAASAEGGTSIAGAPTVQYGVQEFGNTANGTADGCENVEYWGLPVIAGDLVTIDWEESAGTYAGLAVYPVGTTDYTVDDTDSDYYSVPNDNDKAELAFNASRTGTAPLRFGDRCNGYPGPYDFTAFVRHEVVASLSRLSSLPISGTATVGTHTADGNEITSGLTVAVQVTAPNQPWTTIGSAGVTSASTPVSYTVPTSFRGKDVRVRAITSGSAYQTGVSATQAVHAAAAPSVSVAHVISLRSRERAVRRLHRVHLSGTAQGYRSGTTVRIMQRALTGGSWGLEGRTHVDARHRFAYSEVVHHGNRAYRACIGRRCSAQVFVRVTR